MQKADECGGEIRRFSISTSVGSQPNALDRPWLNLETSLCYMLPSVPHLFVLFSAQSGGFFWDSGNSFLLN